MHRAVEHVTGTTQHRPVLLSVCRFRVQVANLGVVADLFELYSRRPDAQTTASIGGQAVSIAKPIIVRPPPFRSGRARGNYA